MSQQKRRLTEPGFDLDLSYIVEDPRRGNVIAMGVPVSGRSAEGACASRHSTQSYQHDQPRRSHCIFVRNGVAHVLR